MTDQELLQAIRAIVKEETAPLGARIDKLDSRIDELDSRMDKLDSRMDKLDSRMDKLDSRIDKLDSRMDKLEKEVQEIKVTQEGVVLPGIKLLAEGHENIVEHIQEKIDARADKLQDAIDVLNVVVKYHSQNINELKKAQ